MRADRLVSLVLLLRQRGRMTAEQLAAELEVSTRTVLRDIEALSASGVPVYAERGRHGGFALLPGFRTELTGLSHDEALAILTATSPRAGEVFGLHGQLTAARSKVLDALPSQQQGRLHDLAARFLIEPDADLLNRARVADKVAPEVLQPVRQAVLHGTRLQIRYAATGSEPRDRVVDPLGLVTSRGYGYLLALREGADRTYRLSRILAAQALPEPAQRPDDVDLARLWERRRAAFLGDEHLAATVRVAPTVRDSLVHGVKTLVAESIDDDGWVRLDVTFDDVRHGLWAVWRVGADVEVIDPPDLRAAVADRARVVLQRHARADPSWPATDGSPGTGMR